MSSPGRARVPNVVVVDLSQGRKGQEEEDDDSDWDIGGGEEEEEEERKEGSHSNLPPTPPPMDKLPPGQPTVVDRAMELAVDRLAQVIRERGGEPVLDDSVDTRRLLDDIATQVSRLSRQERERRVSVEEQGFDTEYPGEEEDSEDSGQEETNRQRTMFDDARKPTPYDLWTRRAHNTGPSSTGPKTTKISKERWDGLVERLYASLRQHDIHVAATQRAMIAKDLAEATFTPKINERSRQLASSGDLSIAERSARLSAQKAQKLDLERQRLVEKELQEATFRPKINESSKVMASSSASRLYESPFERREAAARKASMEREAAERAQYTFSPMINPKSREIAVRGKALQMANSPVKPAPSPRRNSDESFKPTINPHSRRLVGSRDSPGKPIFERLYEEAKEARKVPDRGRSSASKQEKAKPAPSVVVFRPGMEFILETLQKES